MSYSSEAINPLQWAFFAVAALFVFYQMMRGWQRGVMRQVFHLLALVCAYAAAWFGRGLLVPVLRPLGYPDFVLSALAGTLLAFLVFFVITAIGAILFKKTAQQDVGFIRFGYGAAGSVLGLATGLVVVWAVVLAVRLVGAVAEAEIVAQQIAEKRHETGQSGMRQPNVAVRSLAQMKRSLEQGVTGRVMRSVDPIPPGTYTIIHKIGRIIDDPESVNRFMNYPGVKQLSQQPKVAELTGDADIVKELQAGNYLSLLKNAHIVSVANDPQVLALVKKIEFQKALDYALANAQKSPSAGNND